MNNLVYLYLCFHLYNSIHIIVCVTNDIQISLITYIIACEHRYKYSNIYSYNCKYT